MTMNRKCLFATVLALFTLPYCGCSVRHWVSEHFLEHHHDLHANYYHCPECGEIVPSNTQHCCAPVPFYGYAETCWRPWPAGWIGCPDVGCPEDYGYFHGEVIVPERVIYPESIDTPVETAPVVPPPPPTSMERPAVPPVKMFDAPSLVAVVPSTRTHATSHRKPAEQETQSRAKSGRPLPEAAAEDDRSSRSSRAKAEKPRQRPLPQNNPRQVRTKRGTTVTFQKDTQGNLRPENRAEIALETSQNYADALAASNASGTPLLVLLKADWCPACEHMKSTVLPEIQRNGGMKRVQFAVVDTDDEPQLAERLMRGNSIPQLIIFTATDNGWHSDQIVGASAPEDVAGFIASGVEKASTRRR